MSALHLFRFGIDSVMNLFPQTIPYWINHKAVCRTAPASTGLLKKLFVFSHIYKFLHDSFSTSNLQSNITFVALQSAIDKHICFTFSMLIWETILWLSLKHSYILDSTRICVHIWVTIEAWTYGWYIGVVSNKARSSPPSGYPIQPIYIKASGLSLHLYEKCVKNLLHPHFTLIL